MTDYDIVASVRARLSEIILAEIAGVNSVFVNRPKNTADVDLPAVVVVADEAQYDRSEVGMGDVLAITRNYRMILLVKSWYQGLEFEAEDLCQVYFGRFIDAFWGRPSLDYPREKNPLPYVQDAFLTGDSGVIAVSLAGSSFAGIEFTLNVLELLPRNYP